MNYPEPDCHLCAICILREECPVVDKDFPNWNCADFDDGYDGPEYPDYANGYLLLYSNQ